ncbi:unnamed protein product [Cunninghamella echinulata]
MISIFKAIKINDVETIQYLINLASTSQQQQHISKETQTWLLPYLKVTNQKQYNLNCRSLSGKTPLHYAINLNRIKIAQLLIESPLVNVNVRDCENGWTALHRALYLGRIGIVSLLMKRQDLDIRIKDWEGYQALELFDTTIIDSQPLIRKLETPIMNAFSQTLINNGMIMMDDDHMTTTAFENNNNRTTSPSSKYYHHYGGTDLYSWGMNATYLLGHLDSENRSRPERVPLQLESQQSAHFLRRPPYLIKSVHMSKFHMAILTTESCHNLLFCGFGRGGRLGNGKEKEKDVQLAPVPIDWPEQILSVALGRDHSIALTTNGNIITFGSNEYGQLGYDLEDRNNQLNQYTPRKIQAQNLKRQPFIGVAASKVHSVAYTSNELFSFGYNQGQLGYHHLGNDARQISPRKVTFGFKILQIVANDYATVILNQNHDVMMLANYETNKVAFSLNRFPSNIAVHSFATNRIVKVISSGDIYLGAISSMGDVYIWTCKPATQVSDMDKMQQQQRSKQHPTVIITPPKKVWIASKSENMAADASIGQNGEVIICTVSGHVFIGGTTKKENAKDGKFKFQRINHLQRCILVCANPNGSFASIRSEHLLSLPTPINSTFKTDLLNALPHHAVSQSLEQNKSEFEKKKNQLLEKTKQKYVGFNDSPQQYRNDGSESDEEKRNEKMNMELQQIEQQHYNHLDKLILSAWNEIEQYDDPTLDVCFLVQGKPVYCHLSILQGRCGTKINQLFNDSLKNNKKEKVYLEDHIKFTIQQKKPLSRHFFNVIVDGCHLLSVFILMEYIYNDTIDFFRTRKTSPLLSNLPSTQLPDIQDARYDLISLSKFLDLPLLYESVSSIYVPVPQPSLLEDFQHMITTTMNKSSSISINNKSEHITTAITTDVKIILKDGFILCHEVILRQRCPFFKCLFDPKVNWVASRRSEQQHIHVNLDHHSLEIMKLMLIYIYSSMDDEHIIFDSIAGDSIDQLMVIIIQLLGAADEFLLPGLKLLCERTLIPMITLRTAGTLLEYSHYYDSPSLKMACLKLIQVNMFSFVTAGLLTQIDRSLIQELETFICSEQTNTQPFMRPPLQQTNIEKKDEEGDNVKEEINDLLFDDEDIQMTISTWMREETPIATNYMEYLETILPLKKNILSQLQNGNPVHLSQNEEIDIKLEQQQKKSKNNNSSNSNNSNNNNNNKKKGSPRGTSLLFASIQEQQEQLKKKSPSQEYTDTTIPSSWISPDDSIISSSKLSLREIFNEEADQPLTTPALPKGSTIAIKKLSQKERKRLQQQELASLSSSPSSIATSSFSTSPTSSVSQKSVWGVPINNTTPKMKDVINTELGIGNDRSATVTTSVMNTNHSIKNTTINDDELLKGKKIYTSKEKLLDQHQNGWERKTSDTISTKVLFDPKKSLGPSFELIPLVHPISNKGKDKLNLYSLSNHQHHQDLLRRSSFQAIQQEQKLEDDWKKGKKKNLILIQREETAIEELKENYIQLCERGCGEWFDIHPSK